VWRLGRMLACSRPCTNPPLTACRPCVFATAAAAGSGAGGGGHTLRSAAPAQRRHGGAPPIDAPCTQTLRHGDPMHARVFCGLFLVAAAPRPLRGHTHTHTHTGARSRRATCYAACLTVAAGCERAGRIACTIAAGDAAFPGQRSPRGPSQSQPGQQRQCGARHWPVQHAEKQLVLEPGLGQFQLVVAILSGVIDYAASHRPAQACGLHARTDACSVLEIDVLMARGGNGVCAAFCRCS
jgi:hypothetical protein